jgi:hypothetical protein
MCLSAEVDFLSGAVIAGVGVATLREVRQPRELPLAALPLAFALHQITEGFVWLGLEKHVPSAVGDAALYAYLFYAWALLPVIAPLSILLVEPIRRRRIAMGALSVLGAAVGAYLLWSIAHEPIAAQIVGHTLQYRGAGGYGDLVTALYVVAVCATFLLSSHRRIMWFGVANLAAAIVIAYVQADALTSLWCIWGAFVSVLIYLHFSDLRRAEASAVPQDSAVLS